LNNFLDNTLNNNNIKTIQIEGLNIEVIKKKIKNINLTVYPNSQKVRISAPLKINDSALNSFAISRINWIKNQLNKKSNITKPVENKLVDGETHYVFGKPYILNISISLKRMKPHIVFDDNRLSMYINKASTMKIREKTLCEFYKLLLLTLLNRLIAKWETKTSYKVDKIIIKKMKTRWGSNAVRQKKLTFNLDLAKKSQECIEYVVIHEMTHFYERGHNARFKSKLSEYMPDWKNVKKVLNQPI